MHLASAATVFHHAKPPTWKVHFIPRMGFTLGARRMSATQAACCNLISAAAYRQRRQRSFKDLVGRKKKKMSGEKLRKFETFASRKFFLEKFRVLELRDFHVCFF